MLGLLETAKPQEKDHMPTQFKIIVLLLVAYGCLPIFLNDFSFSNVLFGLLVMAIGVGLILGGVCLYHRKPVWERRIGRNGQQFLELVPVWDLRERLGKRISLICIGSGVGALITTFLERAPS
jgi:hypothetical protein